MKLENDPPTPWSMAQPPSPLRLAALGRTPEDMVRPSKEFCSTCTADLWGDGELGAPGDSGLLGAGAGGLLAGQGRSGVLVGEGGLESDGFQVLVVTA